MTLGGAERLFNCLTLTVCGERGLGFNSDLDLFDVGNLHAPVIEIPLVFNQALTIFWSVWIQ